MRIVSLTEDSIKDILSGLLKRNPGQYTEYEKTVNDIIGNVRDKGDEAVFDYTKKFDKWDIDKNSIRVSEQEINEAYDVKNSWPGYIVIGGIDDTLWAYNPEKKIYCQIDSMNTDEDTYYTISNSFEEFLINMDKELAD